FLEGDIVFGINELHDFLLRHACVPQAQVTSPKGQPSVACTATSAPIHGGTLIRTIENFSSHVKTGEKRRRTSKAAYSTEDEQARLLILPNFLLLADTPVRRRATTVILPTPHSPLPCEQARLLILPNSLLPTAYSLLPKSFFFSNH
ncbi:MAG: hypothetical protein ACPGWR_32655, partial [Ardenticatenaceae bacterium]